MRIFYDIDTQNDFMNENGALYVPDAELIKPNIKLLIDFARKNRIQILGSVDNHSKDDPEFETFPPHCVVNSFGQKKFYPSQFNEKYFEKQHYDIFTNPSFIKDIKQRKIQEAIVFGVATDICVRAAVLGLQKEKVQCYLVKDAIKGVFPDKTKQALEEMANAGTIFVTTNEILKGKI